MSGPYPASGDTVRKIAASEAARAVNGWAMIMTYGMATNISMASVKALICRFECRASILRLGQFKTIKPQLLNRLLHSLD